MIFVVLPAYNEEDNLAPLCLSIKKVLAGKHRYLVVLVNDGSSDNTVLEALRIKKEVNLHLINHKRNKGLAGAVNSGFKYSLLHSKDNDIIVTMDADNTHPASLIPSMISLLEGGEDVVIASRFVTGAEVFGLSKNRRNLSNISNFFLRYVFPISGVRDYTCGFRAYKAIVLRQAYAKYRGKFITERGFSCMLDILLKLRPLGIEATEAPLILRYDLKKGKSKMKVFKNISETLILVLKRRVGIYS